MMKSAFVVASLIASCAAFAPPAPQQQGGRASTTEASLTMSDLPGSINFARKEFVFDPLGLATTYEPLLPFLRDAELRHGRTAMLAVPGLIVPEFVRLPGDNYSFENYPNVNEAHTKMWADSGFGSPIFQVFLWITVWELLVAGPAAFAAHNGERDGGDYGAKDWLLKAKKPPTPERLANLVDSELLNGRLAMMAFMGASAQSLVTGHGFPWV